MKFLGRSLRRHGFLLIVWVCCVGAFATLVWLRDSRRPEEATQADPYESAQPIDLFGTAYEGEPPELFWQGPEHQANIVFGSEAVVEFVFEPEFDVVLHKPVTPAAREFLEVVKSMWPDVCGCKGDSK